MTRFQLRLNEWIGRRQQQLSDRLHRSGDAYAQANGWTIIRTTGLFGFGARRYRDRRFDMLRHHDREGSITKRLRPPTVTRLLSRVTTDSSTLFHNVAATWHSPAGAPSMPGTKGRGKYYSRCFTLSV